MSTAMYMHEESSSAPSGVTFPLHSTLLAVRGVCVAIGMECGWCIHVSVVTEYRIMHIFVYPESR